MKPFFQKFKNLTALFLCFSLLSALLCVLPACNAGQGSGSGDSEEETDLPLSSLSVVDISKAEYTYGEMIEDLRLLEEAYPELLTVRSIGKSLDARDIYCAVLGKETAEKQIIIHAGVHAREYMTCLLTMKQLEYYLAAYHTAVYKGTPLSSLLSDYCFYIVPMANPDGVMISQEGSQSVRSPELLEGLRKIYASDLSLGFATTSAGITMDFETYLRYWKANARGVDLNRNYDANWESYQMILTPCFRNYKGTSPASEPETEAMISLTESLSNPVAVISMHAQGNILYWDCGQEDTLPGLSLAQTIHDLTGYRIVYEQHKDASYNDWVILKKNIPSCTVEIGKSSSPLPIGEFGTIYNECRDLWACLAELYLEKSSGSAN